MSANISFFDSNDGYLSDVPTHGSQNTNHGESDGSYDNISLPKIPSNIVHKARAPMLEKQFKDRYNILRQAFEERIAKLTLVVESTCSKLLSDAVIQELGRDKTTAVFVPSHISEVIATNLNNEKEKYIHSILSKANYLESANSKLNEVNTQLMQKIETSNANMVQAKFAESNMKAMSEKLKSIDDEFKRYAAKAERDLASRASEVETLQGRQREQASTIDMLGSQLADRQRECDKLTYNLQLKLKDLSVLEQSFEQSSRELGKWDDIDRQEQLLRRELKEQLGALTAQRNSLYDENQVMKSKLQLNAEELIRLQLLVKQKDAEDAANKQKVSGLMRQVEEMLQQETNDSNKAIVAVHEKMKVFRARLTSEVHREKMHSQALQEELASMRSLKDEHVVEKQSLREQEAALRLQYAAEQAKAISYQSQVNDLGLQLSDCKNKLSEALSDLKVANQIKAEYERLKQQESHMIEQKASLKADLESEGNLRHLNRQAELYRLQYKNDFEELQAKLRHAYSFQLPNTLDQEVSRTVGSDAESEISYRNTLQMWMAENLKLKQKHAAELKEAEQRIKREQMPMMHEMKMKLSEASSNIDKLKAIIQSDKEVIKQQKAMIDHLKADYDKQSTIATMLDSLIDNAQHKDNRAEAEVDNRSNKGGGHLIRSRQLLLPPTAPQPSYGSKLHTAMREIESLRTKHDRKAREVELCVQKINEQSALIQNLSQGHHADLSEVTTPAGDSSKETEEADNLHERVSLLEERIEVVMRERDALQEKLAAIATDHVQAIGELQTQNSELMRRNQTLLGDYEASQQQLQALESAAATARECNAVVTSTQDASVQSDVVEPLMDASIQTIDEVLMVTRVSVATHDEASQTSVELLSSLPQLQRAEALQTSLEQMNDTITSMKLEMASHQQLTDQKTTKRYSEEDLLEQTHSATKHLEELLRHREELLGVARRELQVDRDNLTASRRREAKLFQLIGGVEQAYRVKIHELRRDLMSIRGLVDGLLPYVQVHTGRTVEHLHMQLVVIFKAIQDKYQRQLHACKMELSAAHTREIDALESRFVEQIRTQATQHTQELESMHKSIVSKADQALRLYEHQSPDADRDGSQSYWDDLSADLASLRDMVNGDATDGPTTISIKPVVTFADPVAAPVALVDAEAKAITDSVKKVKAVDKGKTSVALPAAAQFAYESLLKGLMDALVREDVLTNSSSIQITSLAQVHREPSFAAQAAARSLMTGHIAKWKSKHGCSQDR
jgi:hypothetical protein